MKFELIWYNTLHGSTKFIFSDKSDLEFTANGQNQRSISHMMGLETCFDVNLIWGLYNQYDRSYNELFILTSFMTTLCRPVTTCGQITFTSGISGPRPLIWYTTRHGSSKFNIFRQPWPWPHTSRPRSKVKIKVTYDGPWGMLWYKFGLRSLRQIKPKL